MPRSIRPLTISELEALPTQRLLAYRNKLLALEASPELSDWSPAGVAALDPELLWFKSQTRWQELHRQLTSILSGREHVAR